MPQIAAVILAVHGVIVAISKQVLVPVGLFGRHRYYGGIIRIDKPAGCGVIVSALQIVQPALGVVVVPTVAEGVRLRHGALGREYLPVGIIGIAGYGAAAGIQQGQRQQSPSLSRHPAKDILRNHGAFLVELHPIFFLASDDSQPPLCCQN